MKKRTFLLLLATLLFGISCLHYSCKPKKSCCNLPAPDSLIATVISSDSVKLDWLPIVGAVAYRVTVKDITSDTTLPILTTVPNSILLIGLTPNHDYTAIVQAICGSEKECPVSPNGAAVCFRTIIIEDVVIMVNSPENLKGGDVGSGMQDCSCSGTPTQINNNELSFLLPTAPNERKIYKLEIRNGMNSFFIKLAFDQGYPHVIKTYGCYPENIINLNAISPNNLVFKIGTTQIASFKPHTVGGLGKITVTNDSATQVYYTACVGSWTE